MWQSWHWTPSRANRLAFHSAYVFSSSLPLSAKPSGANWWQLWQNSEERNAGVRVTPLCGSVSRGAVLASEPSRRGGPNR